MKLTLDNGPERDKMVTQQAAEAATLAKALKVRRERLTGPNKQIADGKETAGKGMPNA